MINTTVDLHEVRVGLLCIGDERILTIDDTVFRQCTDMFLGSQLKRDHMLEKIHTIEDFLKYYKIERTFIYEGADTFYTFKVERKPAVEINQTTKDSFHNFLTGG